VTLTRTRPGKDSNVRPRGEGFFALPVAAGGSAVSCIESAPGWRLTVTAAVRFDETRTSTLGAWEGLPAQPVPPGTNALSHAVAGPPGTKAAMPSAHMRIICHHGAIRSELDPHGVENCGSWLIPFLPSVHWPWRPAAFRPRAMYSSITVYAVSTPRSTTPFTVAS